MRFSIFAACAFAGVMISTAEARFGQEQAASQIISKVSGIKTAPGDNGKIATLAGGSIGTLLGAADPCALADKLDEMVTFGKTLDAKDSATVVEAAQRAMHVEKNFNPFVAKAASVCLNAAKPASEELRGILPLVDPALAGAADANTKTTQLLEDIISKKVDGAAQAKGKSIAQQMADVVGFSVIQNLAGAATGTASAAGAATGTASAADATALAATTSSAAADNSASTTSAASDAATATATATDADVASTTDTGDAAGSGNIDITQVNTLIAEIEKDLDSLKKLAGSDSSVSSTDATSGSDSSDAGNDTAAADAATTSSADASSSTAGTDATSTADATAPAATDASATQAADGAAPTAVTKGQTLGNAADSPISLGSCKEPPTIEFAAGLDGRKATELTFRPANPTTFPGQSTALNPVIIVNFLCDRLNDKCQAQEARTKCEELKAQFQTSGDRSGAVADTFNAAFGVKTNFAALGSNAKN